MAIDNQFGKGIGLAAGFDLGAQKPLDSRIAVNTIAERDAHVTENRAYEGMIVFVDDDKKLYQLINGEWIELLGDINSKLETIENQLGLGDSTEGNSISDRVNSLETKDTELAYAISNEAKSREDADNELQEAINSIIGENGSMVELEARVEANEAKLTGLKKETVQAAIDQAEADAKADTVTKINNLKTELNGAIESVQSNIENEATSRAEADSDLQGQIDTINSNIGEIGVLGSQVKANKEAIDAINDIDNGILKQAKDYTDSEIVKAVGVAPSETINGSGLKKDIADAEKRANVYTDNAIADLIDGAPEALDTLNELANALKDDANFSTTIATEIGKKADTTYVDTELAKKVDKVTGSRLISETEAAGYAAKAEVSQVNQALADAKTYTNEEIAKITSGDGSIGTRLTAVETKNSEQDTAIAENASDLNSHASDKEIHITEAERTAWNAKSEFDGNYNSLTNKPTIPSKTSELTNDSGYMTDVDLQPVIKHASSDHAPSNAQKNSDITKEEIEAKLVGDIATHTHSQYLTSHQDISGKADKSDLTAHTNNNDIHVTKAQKDVWDAKETTSGAQSKADAALQSAETYADAQDTALHTTISSEIDSDVAAEATLRSNADTALSNRIANFEAGGANDISALETNLKAYADQAEADAIKTAGEALATGLAKKANKEHGNHVPETQSVNNKVFLRNDNTWAEVKPENIGAAPTTHGTHVTYATITPLAPGVAAIGTSDKVAREDHVHPLQTNVAGNAGTANKLAAARTITVKGDASGSVSFDGSADRDLNLTLSNSGVTVGTYGPTGDAAPDYKETFKVPQVTVDAKGRITSVVDRTITLPEHKDTVINEATGSSAGLMSAADKAKLDKIADEANKYVHPATHDASIITQDETHRFVSDTEKADWNAKETTSGAQSKADTAAANALKDAKTYADQKVSDLVDGAPEALDTLKELADALSTHEGAYNGLLEVVGKKTDKTYVDTELGKKVDKVEGSRLVTTAEVAKWDAKAEVSQVNQALTDAKGYADSEIAKITTGEGSIGARLTAVEAKNTEQDTAIANAQKQADKGVADAAAEATRAQAAEKVLTDNLAAEVTRATNAETANKNAIATNSNAITVLNGDSTVEGSVDKKIADNNIFDTDILTVNALGGIKAGENLNGMTIEEVLKKLLYPYVAHLVSASSSPNGGVFECGNNQTVTEIKATITKKSEPITKVEFVDGSNVLETKTDGIAAGGSVTHSCSIIVSTNNKSFTVNVTDKSGKVVTATTGKFTFVYPYYWGVCANDATIDEAMVKGLTKKVETKGSKGVTYTANFQRAVIAYPASYGNIKKILDPNSFDVTATFTKHSINVTGLDGKSVAYYVYVNSAFTATNFKFTFSY